MIEVYLELGYDVNTAMAEMLSKINEVQGRLPQDITDPVITKATAGGDAIMYIAYQSSAGDAKGLLKTACRINDPVIFCEHKALYRQSFASSPEPDENYLIPFGKAAITKEGNDVTVVSYGLSMWDSVFAARRLEEEGFSV